MKKNKLMKVSAILATALMAASAAGVTVSANEAKTVNPVRTTRTTRSASRTTRTSKRAKSGATENEIEDVAADASISLTGGKKVKPGETFEVPVIINSGNKCSCYDVLVEYDARFEFVEVKGAQASCDFEKDGRKYVSLVGYSDETYTDGEAVATIKLRVPKNAENDDYQIRFSQITTLSSDFEDFENYDINNTVFTVIGGVKKQEGNTISLRSVTGMAGDSAVVQLVPNTGNKCAAFDLLVEYDSRLLLEDRDVANANSFCIFEEGGKSYVSLVGYTSGVYADGDIMAALNFHIPDDATSADKFEVKIHTVTDISSEYQSIEDYTTKDAVISVFESARPNDKYKEHKVFKKFAANGSLIASSVGMRGDANSDGKADVRDAAAVAVHCANRSGVDEMGQFFADVDDNNKMDVRDAAKIARYVANGKTSWDAINGK